MPVIPVGMDPVAAPKSPPYTEPEGDHPMAWVRTANVPAFPSDEQSHDVIVAGGGAGGGPAGATAAQVCAVKVLDGEPVNSVNVPDGVRIRPFMANPPCVSTVEVTKAVPAKILLDPNRVLPIVQYRSHGGALFAITTEVPELVINKPSIRNKVGWPPGYWPHLIVTAPVMKAWPVMQ